MNGPSKSWSRSRTIWGAAGAALVALTGTVSDLAGTAEQIERLATVLLSLYAIWGRVQAEQRIGPTDGK
ncbi:MAG: hypothetical protein IT472_08920 [Thermomonas sp.]|uniref:hypothetical protein n=1 Tax=Thermomonas sp. TaxID=1971895 RepID=UPI0026248D69|nr:hypothetical protein [Thermomonas sp.]MCC7097287.1 hypothetical protein [Thermomonas sp.]